MIKLIIYIKILSNKLNKWNFDNKYNVMKILYNNLNIINNRCNNKQNYIKKNKMIQILYNKI